MLTELETPEREAILKPRHFNPHPYEYSNRFDKSLVQRQIQPASTSIFNQGPIQFPPINQENTPKRSDNPYADIALRNRQKKLQRIVGFVSKNNYKALQTFWNTRNPEIKLTANFDCFLKSIWVSVQTDK